MLKEIIKKVKTKFNTKITLLTFIILTIIVLFILSNSLEYNFSLNKYSNYNEQFNNVNTNIADCLVNFKGNNLIKLNNDIALNNIYYDEFDTDLQINSIVVMYRLIYSTTTTPPTSSIPSIIDNDFIKKIFILDNSTLNVINVNISNININDIIVDINKVNINLNTNIILDSNNTYQFVIVFKDDNEINITFTVENKRFRFSKSFLLDNQGKELDVITLSKYNVNKDIIDNNIDIDIDNNIKYDLDKFNKLTFIINKPDLLLIKDAISKQSLNSSVKLLTNLTKFDNFILNKFKILFYQVSNVNNINVKPKYSLPNTGAYCLDDKINKSSFTPCKLTLSNLLPNETYEIVIQIIYTDSNNINTYRVSKKYIKRITISEIKDNDILLNTLIGVNNFKFTNELISSFNFINDFKKSENIQNDKLRNIENSLNNELNKYNI